MLTQSKDSGKLVQHPASLVDSTDELKERASNSSPTTLLLLLVVPIVLVVFADFAFAVATKSSVASRAAVRTAGTSSSGESASGGSGADAKVKDEGKTLMNRKSTAKAHTAQKKHDLVSRESTTRRKKWSTGSRKSNKSYLPGGHQQRSTVSPRTTEVVYMEPSSGQEIAMSKQEETTPEV